MRLICPNCDAQYEVDDGAVPPGGRDVQCSNCGHAWFQMHVDALAEGDAAEEVAVAAPAGPEPSPVPPVIEAPPVESAPVESAPVGAADAPPAAPPP